MNLKEPKEHVDVELLKYEKLVVQTPLDESSWRPDYITLMSAGEENEEENGYVIMVEGSEDEDDEVDEVDEKEDDTYLLPITINKDGDHNDHSQPKLGLLANTDEQRSMIYLLLGYFSPPLLADLLKVLVHRKHEGLSLQQVLQTLPEQYNVYNTLLEKHQFKPLHSDYYLLPVDQYGKVDLDRVEDHYIHPSEVSPPAGECDDHASYISPIDSKGPLKAFRDLEVPRDTLPNEYVDSRLMSGANLYESLLKTSPPGTTAEEKEIALNLHFLMNEELTDLKNPDGGWYTMPHEEEQTLSSAVALISHMMTNILEVKQFDMNVLHSNLLILKEKLKEVCDKIDTQFPGPLMTRDILAKMVDGKPDNSKVEHALQILKGISSANNTIDSLVRIDQYEQLEGAQEDIYEEIKDTIHQEANEEVYEVIIDPANEKEDDLEKVPLKSSQSAQGGSKYTQLKNTNEGLVQRSITLFTIHQQAMQEADAKEVQKEVGVVTKGLRIARDSLDKVAEFIRKELQKVRALIDKRKQDRKKRLEEREIERERQKAELALAKRQQIPLPDVPITEEAGVNETDDDKISVLEEDEENEYEQQIRYEELRLQKLEERKEETDHIYARLTVANSMLNNITPKSEKGYYEALFERHMGLLVSNVKLRKIKSLLVVATIFSSDEWSAIEKLPPNEQIEKVLNLLLTKQDYACKSFLDILRKNRAAKPIFNKLIRKETEWKQASFEKLFEEKDGEVNWAGLVSCTEPKTLTAILQSQSLLSNTQLSEFDRKENDMERRALLLESLKNCDKEMWSIVVSEIRDQELTHRNLLQSWDDSDHLGNWMVVLDNLPLDMILTTLLFRYLITPRQYTEVASRQELADKKEKLQKLLSSKKKSDWEIFMASVKNGGFGSVLKQLLNKQQQWLERPPKLPFEHRDTLFDYEIARSGFVRGNIGHILYDPIMERIIIGLKNKVIVFSWMIDRWTRKLTVTGLPTHCPFAVDVKRNLLLYAKDKKIYCRNLSKKNQEKRFIMYIADGLDCVNTINHYIREDVYIISNGATQRVTLSSTSRKPVDGIDTTSPDNSQFSLGQYSSLEGQLSITWNTETKTWNVPDGTKMQTTHNQNSILCSSLTDQLDLVKPEGDTVKESLPETLIDFHIGFDGTLTIAYTNGFLATYVPKDLNGLNLKEKLKKLGFEMPLGNTAGSKAENYKLSRLHWLTTKKTITHIQCDLVNRIIYVVQKARIIMYKISDRTHMTKVQEVKSIKENTKCTILMKKKQLLYLKDKKVFSIQIAKSKSEQVFKEFGDTIVDLSYDQGHGKVLILTNQGRVKVFNEMDLSIQHNFQVTQEAGANISAAHPGKVTVIADGKLVLYNYDGGKHASYTLPSQGTKVLTNPSVAMTKPDEYYLTSPSLSPGLLRILPDGSLHFAESLNRNIGLIETGPQHTLIASSVDGDICLYKSEQLG